jgi:hypothetical protein
MCPVLGELPFNLLVEAFGMRRERSRTRLNTGPVGEQWFTGITVNGVSSQDYGRHPKAEARWPPSTPDPRDGKDPSKRPLDPARRHLTTPAPTSSMLGGQHLLRGAVARRRWVAEATAPGALSAVRC